MARLPIPDGDNGQWGNILNDYLSQVHKADGTLKDGTVSLSTITTNTVVDLSSDQTVHGVKTFNSSPLVPTPTSGMQAANKAYVDDNSGPVAAGNTTGATNATAIDSVMGTAGHTVAASDGSIAIGYDGTNAASATGASSVAIGADSVANGYFATALGPTASATGDSSTAIGWGAEATGEGSVALGGGTYSESGSQGAYADGNNALAIGTSNATGQQSIAIGSSTANGYEATAMGFNNLAQGDQALAVGSGNAVYSQSALAIGQNSTVDDNSAGATALGSNAIAAASTNALAINGSVLYGNGSVAIAGYTNNAASATAINGVVNGNAGTANGGVAIGADASGVQAQAGVDNQFVLGTPNHNVQVPGTLAVALDAHFGRTISVPTIAPQAPQDGQLWITSTGLYFQAGGVTHGPIT